MGGIKPIIISCVALFLFAGTAMCAGLKETDPEVLSKANHITIPFLENKGQLDDPNILFYSNTFAGRVSVNRDGSIGYSIRGNKAGQGKRLNEIREKLGCALKASPSGGQKAMAKVSHFQGKDPQKWVTDIPTFNSVNVGEIYEGVSLKLKAHANNVEKIFAVHPGADPTKLQLTIDGAKALHLTAKGELEVDTGAGSMRFTQPVAYQWIHGRKTPVDVAYSVKGSSYGFELAAYDKSKELIIDPLITGSFQGVTGAETVPTCMAADRQDNIYIAGRSGNQYAVYKYDSTLENLLGSALFASPSWSRERIHDIAVDRQGAIYLVGATQDVGATPDKDFPVTEGAFDDSFNTGRYSSESVDGFVIKFNSDLNTILSSTFIGGNAVDEAFGIAISQDETVYVVGATSSPPLSGATPFPTSPDAYDTAHGLPLKTKAFIMRLDSKLETMLASTLLGYNGDVQSDAILSDSAFDVAIDSTGAIVVAGMTRSEHFPVTGNRVDASFQGESEAFISKFDPDLENLLASTFLGGANKEKANVLGIAGNNEIVVAGWTLSSDFPVVQGNYDTSYNSDEDGFVSRLSSDLTAIRASTFLGGQGPDQVSDMVIGEDGTVFLCGGTGSSDFPVAQNFYDNSFNGVSSPHDFYEGDGFLTIFDERLTTLSASTYLGGMWYDHITSIFVNDDDIFVAGETSSSNFPYIDAKKGNSDAFICRFNANEQPETRPFNGRPGHWQSKNGGLAGEIYLDVNICDDGTFRGIWKAYTCAVPGMACVLADDSPSASVTGTMDFQNWVGTITLLDDSKVIPFRISKQLPDELLIEINPDGSADDPPAADRFFIYYKGESGVGKCDVGPSGDNGGSGGGGSGGCFLESMAGS